MTPSVPSRVELSSRTGKYSWIVLYSGGCWSIFYVILRRGNPVERYSLVSAALFYPKANHTPLCELISTHFIRILMILLFSTRFQL